MKVFVIAEIGSIHDGSFTNAMQAVELAKDCGADAVKFQMHIPEDETLINAPSPPFFSGEKRWNYFKRTSFTIQQWSEIKFLSEVNGIEFMASPFSETASDILFELGMKRWKIPSGEVTNIPLIEKIASFGGLIILSSGMSTWDELDLAVKVIFEAGGRERLTVLQCTSEYPCETSHVGINVMEEMRHRYRVSIGLSDHTLSIFTPIVAVSKGAMIIEKHLTFSRRLYGSDARHSLEPDEFAMMVNGIRETEKMLSSVIDKDSLMFVKEMKPIFEKSIVLRQTCRRNTVINRSDIDFKKPGTGISPSKMSNVVGRKLKRDMEANEMLSWEDLEE